MTSQPMVILATLGSKGGDGPQFHIDGAGHLHRVPPWTPRAQAAFQAAMTVALASDELQDAEDRAKALGAAEALLAEPLKELSQVREARQQVTELLKDAHLQQALRDTPDRQKTVALIVAAAEKRGLQLGEQRVAQLLAALTCTRAPELSREELLWVGGAAKLWSSPHTEKCTCPHCHPH